MFNESPFSYRSNDIMNVRNKQTDKKSNKQTDPSHTTYIIAVKWRHSSPLEIKTAVISLACFAVKCISV